MAEDCYKVIYYIQFVMIAPGVCLTCNLFMLATVHKMKNFFFSFSIHCESSCRLQCFQPWDRGSERRIKKYLWLMNKALFSVSFLLLFATFSFFQHFQRISKESISVKNVHCLLWINLFRKNIKVNFIE